MRARDLTLDAISEDSTQAFTVSSPRSVEALARQGILVQELQFRSFEDFREAGVPEEVAQMRFQHYDIRRRERIKQVQHEYRTVCSTPGKATPRAAHRIVPPGLGRLRAAGPRTYPRCCARIARLERVRPFLLRATACCGADVALTRCRPYAHAAHSRGHSAEFSGAVGSTLDESGAQVSLLLPWHAS
jgi:hypothetical protein